MGASQTNKDCDTTDASKKSQLDIPPVRRCWRRSSRKHHTSAQWNKYFRFSSRDRSDRKGDAVVAAGWLVCSGGSGRGGSCSWLYCCCCSSSSCSNTEFIAIDRMVTRVPAACHYGIPTSSKANTQAAKTKKEGRGFKIPRHDAGESGSVGERKG